MYYLETNLKKLAFFVVALGLCFGGGNLCADFPTDPHIEIDSSGNQVAIWEVDGDTSSSIQSSTFITSWSAATTISGGDSAFGTKFVSNASGQIAAAWFVLDGVNSIYNIKVTTYDSGTNTWSTPTLITSTNEDVNQFQLKINSTGATTIIWTSYDVNDQTTKSWTSIASTYGGSWSTPHQLF